MPPLIRTPKPLPKDKPAELVVHNLGSHPAATIDLIQEITELPRRAMNKLSGALPVMFTLPKPYYDRTEPLVAKLRANDGEFSIIQYALVCPREEIDNKHWCTPDCPVMPIVEQVT